MRIKQSFLLVFLLCAMVLGAKAEDTYKATRGTAGYELYHQTYDKLVDGHLNSKWCVRGVSSPANIYIEFKSSEPIVPKSYILTTGDDNESYPGRNPKDWVLKARANETDDWTVLATVTDDTKMRDLNKTGFLFPLNNDNEYQYFRFEVSAIKNGDTFQLAELKLLTSSLYFQATGGTIAGPAGTEDFDKLVDGFNNTKWCINNNTAEIAYVEFLSSEPITPTGYVLTTANDTEKYPGRNPKNWKLKAKLNAGDEWGTLATQTNDEKLQASNYTNFVYSLNKPNQKYQYFRFEVTPDEGETGLVFQLAELKLLTTAILEATEGTAGNSTKAGYDRLFDVDKNAKWCVTSLGNPTYVEFQSSEAIVPLGYVLTTANDTENYTTRNPKGWKLMAKRYSTDSEWTDLSTVKDDNIIGNKNRAEYTFGVDNADKKEYQFFRFEVSGVQDGNIFQLAELKMLTADDAPNMSAVVVLDAADNADVLAGGGSKSDVILLGRTLYKDGCWNTLCLPFSLDAFTGTPLAGADVRALESSSLSGTTLMMNFSESSLTAVEAGKPYLVKWADPDNTIDDIISPAFNNVTINNTITKTTTDCIDFVGTFSPVALTADMEGVMVLGAGNTLNYPKAGTTIKSCRAYFVVNDKTVSSTRSFVLNFGGDEATGIRSVAAAHDDRWYSLDGRRLNAKPSQKGIYINNGKILVIK